MSEKTRVGIIICDRYRTCTGGKCLRSLRQKEGAFAAYEGKELASELKDKGIELEMTGIRDNEPAKAIAVVDRWLSKFDCK